MAEHVRGLGSRLDCESHPLAFRVSAELAARGEHVLVDLVGFVFGHDADVRRHHVRAEVDGEVHDLLRARHFPLVVLGKLKPVAAEVAAERGDLQAQFRAVSLQFLATLRIQAFRAYFALDGENLHAFRSDLLRFAQALARRQSKRFTEHADLEWSHGIFLEQKPFQAGQGRSLERTPQNTKRFTFSAAPSQSRGLSEANFSRPAACIRGDGAVGSKKFRNSSRFVYKYGFSERGRSGGRNLL